MRRFLVLVAGSVTMLVVSASAAVAQQYPPEARLEKVTPGRAGGGEFAFTGSNSLPLLWIGLAALVVGIALVVATTRRARLRTRGADLG